jgi:tetratricopeptide (TPR) repeat protein
LKVASLPSSLAGAAIAGFFVVRAAYGIPAAWDGRRGDQLAGQQLWGDATPMFDRGALGADRAGFLWQAGRSRIGFWYSFEQPDRATPRGELILGAAVARYLGLRAASPASAYSTSELADVYACRESIVRARRVPDLDTLEGGAWALVGDDGRVSIGLARAAVLREPNNCVMRDRLMLLLAEYGLRAEALAAMADSARVLPDFFLHQEFTFDSLPVVYVEAFWRAARTVGPDDAPLLDSERRWVSVGLLGRRLGHLEEAEQDFRTALKIPSTRLAHAEAAFHLGLVLSDLGRLDEAESMLALAVKEPVFEPAVAETRARIAIKEERWADALDQLGRIRKLHPREVPVLVQFAWVAQRAAAWDKAEEALRWAILVHPEDPAPRRALVEMFLAKGEKAAARQSFDDYVLSFGKTADVTRLEDTLARTLDQGPR